MKKIIIVLLSAILCVGIICTYAVLNDNFDEDLYRYLDVQLYDIYFEEDYEFIISEIDILHEVVARKLEGTARELTPEEIELKFSETLTIAIELEANLLFVDSEIQSEDIKNLNFYLLESLTAMISGLNKLEDSYNNVDWGTFEKSSALLDFSLENYLYWDELIMEEI